MTKHIIPLAFALALTGCVSMEAKIKIAEIEARHEKIHKELVPYMSLKTMFPDPQVRALAKAAGRGQINKINRLVGEGVGVNARGASNATPLFWAMQRSSAAGFERLLELGADPNVVHGDLGAIMHWAVRHEDSEYLKMALEHGGDPNLVAGIDKWTPLFIAMWPDYRDKIPTLLAAGADMNRQAESGTTPLMIAALLGEFGTVHYLLELGADYQLRDDYTKGTLVNHISYSRRFTPRDSDRVSDLRQWKNKVIDWLAVRGVEVPEWKTPAKQQ